MTLFVTFLSPFSRVLRSHEIVDWKRGSRVSLNSALGVEVLPKHVCVPSLSPPLPLYLSFLPVVAVDGEVGAVTVIKPRTVLFEGFPRVFRR